MYGMGTIIPKILNYIILTAYYTRLFQVKQFGVITELYAYVAFLLIILTYGTETGYFRFARDGKENAVFSNLIASLLLTSSFFIIIILLLSGRIAEVLQYEGNEKYIRILAAIIGIDAFCSIPFAKLRKEEKSIKFASLKIVNVLATIGAVMFFYELTPFLQNNYNLLTKLHTEGDVVYVLYSNLIASSVILLLLIPEVKFKRSYFDWKLLKSIISFSFPLLIAGLAGTINDTLDRALMKHIIENKDEALYILGIYGANFRIAMLLYYFIQMFRYAVEPFYFNYFGNKDEKETFAGIMRVFIGVIIVFIMVVLFYLDYIKFFIPPRYHEGTKVIPVVLVAFLFYGIFFNQSIWYKLTKKTGFAILLTLAGALVTVIANVFFVKRYSYMAAAFGHLFAYSLMMILSYFLSRKYYHIDYKLKRILEYLLVAIAIFGIRYLLLPEIAWIKDIAGGLLIVAYTFYILTRESLLINIKNLYGSKNS